MKKKILTSLAIIAAFIFAAFIANAIPVDIEYDEDALHITTRHMEISK